MKGFFHHASKDNYKQPWQLVLSVRTSLRTRLRTRLGFQNRPNLLPTCTLTKKENPRLSFPDLLMRGFLLT